MRPRRPRVPPARAGKSERRVRHVDQGATKNADEKNENENKEDTARDVVRRRLSSSPVSYTHLTLPTKA